MIDRWAYLFERTNGFSFDELVHDIETNGAQLANPSSGRITRLTVDGLGVEPLNPGSEMQITSTQAELASLIGSGYEVPFQWWFDSGHDVFCSIRRITAEIICERYDLPYHRKAQQIKLCNVLLSRFLRGRERDFSIGLIFDPEGVNDGFDWKQYFLDERAKPRLLPEVVIVPVASAGRLTRIVRGGDHFTQAVDGFTMIAKPNSPYLSDDGRAD